MKEEERIVEIMREIYYNPEKLQEDYFVDKYGQLTWDLFTQFTVPRLCSIHPGNKLKLSQDGASEYHRLVAERQNLQIAKDNVRKTDALVYSTSAMALATIILAMTAVITTLTTSKAEFWVILLNMGAFLFLIVIAFVLLKKAYDLQHN